MKMFLYLFRLILYAKGSGIYAEIILWQALQSLSPLPPIFDPHHPDPASYCTSSVDPFNHQDPSRRYAI